MLKKNISLRACKYFVIVISIISCDKDTENCQNYILRENYSVENFFSDAETYEKINNIYIDNNKENLDLIFDYTNIFEVRENRAFYNNRIHFKLNFKNNSTGFFQDGKDSLSLLFDYNYIQDSVVILSCNNTYEYQFFLNDNCKLEHCVYLISTFRSFPFKNYEVIYSTYCHNKTESEVANEFLMQYGSNSPDTIGIIKYTIYEN